MTYTFTVWHKHKTEETVIHRLPCSGQIISRDSIPIIRQLRSIIILPIIKINNKNNNNGTERRSSNFSQSPHCAVNCLQTYTHVAWAQSCENPVQQIERVSHATCRVPHSTKGQLSYQVWPSWNRIYFSFILLAEPLTTENRKILVTIQAFLHVFRLCEHHSELTEEMHIQTDTKERLFVIDVSINWPSNRKVIGKPKHLIHGR